ncbi:MAG: tetratricopeptide repeat protein [Bryobacteraceae bacterium]
MRMIRALTTEDRVLLDQMAGAVLQREGKLEEAGSHYRAVLVELTGAGREASADGVAIRGQLASLYLQDHRYADARKTADDALTSLNAVTSVPPLYRMKVLNVRAIAWTRMGRWREAESDLAEAVSLGRSQTRLDNAELLPVVSNYASVLRKLRRKKARSVERWAASLRSGNIASSLIVDISELPPHWR